MNGNSVNSTNIFHSALAFAPNPILATALNSSVFLAVRKIVNLRSKTLYTHKFNSGNQLDIKTNSGVLFNTLF